MFSFNFFNKNLWEEFLRYKELQGLSKKYIIWLKTLFNHINNTNFLDLKNKKSFTLENCIAFLNHKSNWKNTSYNFYTKLLIVFLNYLIVHYNIEDFTKKIPMRKVIKRVPKFYNTDELQEIFSSVREEEEEKNVLLFFLYTWVRRDEFLHILPQDIKNDYIYIRNSKWGRDRVIPLHEEVKKINIKFPYEKPKLLKLLSKIQKDFKCFKFHNLRHTFSYNLKNSWCDIYDVSQLLWHKDISSTLAYSSLDVLGKKQKINKIKFDFLEK